jgi:hypothetical protein
VDLGWFAAMMNQSRTRAGLYLAAVFIAGSAFGFSASQFYSQPTAEAGVDAAAAYRRDLLHSLDERLDLSDKQLGEVIAIFDEIRNRFREVRDAMEPEFEAIRSERAGRVMGLLNPQQKAEYQLMVDERQRAREANAIQHSEQRK